MPLPDRDWLVNTIHDEALAAALRRYARGRLLDVGCGTKPYATMTTGVVSEHIGVDSYAHPEVPGAVDVVAHAEQLPFESASFDTVLCSQVLEHLEDPLVALMEMHRVLKPGGVCLLTVPFMYRVHDDADYYRFTARCLERLLQRSSFIVEEVTPLSGVGLTLSVLLVHAVYDQGRGVGARFRRAFAAAIQKIAYGAFARRHPHKTEWTWNYLAVARAVEG